MIKGLMLINNKVEDVEALATKALLTRSGMQIDTFTLENIKEITTAYNTKVIIDFLSNELDYKIYDFLILPGGSHVFNFVDEDTVLYDIIKYYNDKNKLIAAICAAPLFLNKLNLLKNKEFTSYPSVKNDIDGIYVNEKVVRSGNIITSRSAGSVYDFVFEIIKYLKNNKILIDLKEEIVYN